MKNERREFLKITGLAGLGVLGGSGTGGHASEARNDDEAGRGGRIDEAPQPRVQRFNMSGYAAEPIDTVRVGIIGMGQRGPGHMRNLARIEGVAIKALCDVRPEKAKAAKARLANTAHDPDLYTASEEDWKKLCDRDDIDLVIVTTPWTMHTKMAVYAMNRGKHVASEVPAAATIDECWKLVETSERTRRHLMMTENYAYMPFQLLTLNMARKGFFGEVVHGDCAYNTSKMSNNFSKQLYWNMWWLRQYGSRKGNIYPTHGLGPVAQIMGINRGDRFRFLVSVESKDFMMAARAEELAAKDEFFRPFTGKDYRGNMSTTQIKTMEGRTIMVQHDATSPSPHNLIHGIYGTKGAALFDPQPPRISKGNHRWASPEEFAAIREKYTPAISRKLGELAKNSGHGGSDLLIDWRLIDCLRNGLPLDQDVYDAAAWSAVLPLSDRSVRNGSNSVEIPDFTAGAWKKNENNMDIELTRGGTTRVLG